MAQNPAIVGFLRIPPFPGAKPPPLVAPGETAVISDGVVDKILSQIADLKVGGSYWGSQPKLPDTGYTIIRATDPKTQKKAGRAAIRVLELPPHSNVDPWHILSRADAVVANADDELALLAAISGVPVRCLGQGRFSSLQSGGHPALRQAFRAVAVEGVTYRNPFNGEELDLSTAVELCGFWRGLIDSNRAISSALGFAFWKRKAVEPLLWNGSGKVPFASKLPRTDPRDQVAVWKSRTDPKALAQLEQSNAKLVEVEDGFVRSAGLGADCIPPLSIVVDHSGIYFDPARPSDLERLLQDGNFPEEILERARRLRQLIVDLGVSKYGAAHSTLERRTRKQHVLVVGQVEDDRAVTCGLGPRTNLELLSRVRKLNPESYVIYRPHPDIEAGHRAGAIADEECLSHANEINRHGPISSLIGISDEVHVNTSLAGFEALLRNKSVTTYGVPFYAGWGLTRDFGPVPPRRASRRSLDELVAATLLLYPRYIDPLTSLPCPPELLVRRIAEGRSNANNSLVVSLRRLQGRVSLALAKSWRARP